MPSNWTAQIIDKAGLFTIKQQRVRAQRGAAAHVYQLPFELKPAPAPAPFDCQVLPFGPRYWRGGPMRGGSSAAMP